ncbi:tyrosine-protein phosphatase [Reinekea blandensis]|uniref:protein-tyrosine-phosphatase n=1 Tax=Reinekea blandensis MED297 TaxID=314283 RepID=A4BIJ3_9GAMM|nr:tyrosine-protein phosphatase [Reinekea blandensis]EAR08072.1 phosphatase, putative [Reinekea sp. MED297] [Reinekea blandensis MED297]
MTHPFDTLPLPTGGAFVFTPCPGTRGEALPDALSRLKHTGASTLITMLSNEELDHLGVPDLGKVAADEGFHWVQLPIEDDCAPEAPFEQAFAQHGEALLQRLTAGETLVIHCRGGTGRTGLMAAILLLNAGMDGAEVQSRIQSVRPKALTIDTQTTWLKARYPAFN